MRLLSIVALCISACTTGTLTEQPGDFADLAYQVDAGPSGKADDPRFAPDAGDVTQPDAAISFCPMTAEDCDAAPACTSWVVSDCQCQVVPLSACVDDDGCCPGGCTANDDNDCSVSCGNGSIERGETCDPLGSCPSSCDDANACTRDVMAGSAANCNATCTHTTVTQCTSDDGCCPAGCDANSDSDCTAVCGNGIPEAGELCDGPGNCPTSCNDGNACTSDTLTGSASTCDAQCSYAPIETCRDNDGCCAPGCNANNDSDCSATCGNGTLEAGETCDGAGSCPTSCNDGNACTSDMLTGSAQSCSAACTHTNILQCIGGDGCCAPGCNANNDSDCEAVCDNGVKEPGETCDPEGSCPTSCNDGNACTKDTLSGSSSLCTAQCRYTTISACQDGDGCCPGGCNFDQDSDCPPPPPPTNPDCTNATTWPWRSVEAEVLSLVNMVRASGATCGSTAMPPVSAVKRNAALDQASRCHSADMAAQNYFSHTSLDGRSPWTRMDDAGYNASPTGENIARGQRSAAAVMDSWMNSEGHCKNIMSSGTNEIGIGAVFEWDGQSIAPLWTQGFGRR